MPYWMTNPDHGMMPLYDMGEVERVKRFGWTLLNVGESPQVPVFTSPQEALAPKTFPPTEWPTAVIQDMRDAEAPKRKPGRPRKGE